GLARHITAAGVRVVEVDRSDRQDRRRQGKSDSFDAVSAARAAQSGRACGTSKGRDGAVEAIRALMVAKRSAAGERTQTINQARALVLTGPDDLRARFTGHTAAALVAELASLRPRPGSTVGYATRIALRELGRRAEFLDGQLERLDEFIGPLVAARAPGLLALYGIGPHTAALLLIAAGDHPDERPRQGEDAVLAAGEADLAADGAVAVAGEGDVGDEQVEQALAFPHGGGRVVPQGGEVCGQGQDAGLLVLIERGVGVAGSGVVVAGVGELAQPGVPVGFQVVCHQPVG